MWGYWVVLFASILEAVPPIGFVLPSGIIVGMFGFFAAQGYYDIKDLVWIAGLGAVIGDTISYYLGTKGTRFFRNENRILRLSHVDKAKEFFNKHGNKSVVLSRFIGPLRPLIPFVAGISGMNKWSFLLWNVIGGFLWATLMLIIGYFSGGAFATIKTWSTRAGLFLLVITVAAFIIWFLIQNSRPVFRFLRSISISIKDAIMANPDVRKLVNRYPNFFHFIKNRFDKSIFSGLPLTLLGTIFIYAFFLFVGTIQDVINSEAIAIADVRIANLLYTFRDIELLKVFTWVTLLAKWYVIVTAAMAFAVILWLWGKRTYIIALLVTIGGAALLNSLAKLAIHRPRPELGFYTEQSYSFPSGHATLAIAFYGFVAYLLLRHVRRWKVRVSIILSALLVIIAIGFSRMYLGVHFFSDVWGGYLMGTLWLLIGISVAEILTRKPRFSILHERKPIVQVRTFTAILLIAELLVFVGLGLQYQPERGTYPLSEVHITTTDILKTFADAKLPHYTETLIGNPQEPLNFIFIAKDDTTLIRAMEKSGWQKADPVNIGSVFKFSKAALLNQSYPPAPMTPSFWDAKVHDLGFEKPTDAASVRERHHVRVWKTNIEFNGGYRVYVGTGSLDIGLKYGITHTIKPDIDTEREYLFNNLQTSGVIVKFQKEQFVEPTLGQNFSGDPFFTDGKTYLIFLK